MGNVGRDAERCHEFPNQKHAVKVNCANSLPSVNAVAPMTSAANLARSKNGSDRASRQLSRSSLELSFCVLSIVGAVLFLSVPWENSIGLIVVEFNFFEQSTRFWALSEPAG